MILKSGAVLAVGALAKFATVLSGVVALAILLLTASLFAVATSTGLPHSEGRCLGQHFVYGLGSDFTELFSVLAALTVTVFTKLAWIAIEIPLEKHSQYSFKHLDFLQLHLRGLCGVLSSLDIDIL